MRLYGRDEETATIDRLLQHARGGRSGALVVRGEAGIGKSALLEDAAGRAEDMRVLRGAGIESEAGLPYAGLHLLLRKHIDRVDALPEAQARALRNALSVGDGSGGDRFLVGLAVLTLLSDLAEERPLLCLIDDAHWLDSPTAEALLFAVRRLDAEAILFLFGVRDPGAPEFAAAGIPELRLRGLNEAEAAELLAERAKVLPRDARHRILSEAMGNPLALLELPIAGRETPRPDPSSAYTRVERAFAEQADALPEATRTLLLLTAADERGELRVILPAAERLGAAVTDLEPAERAGLLRTSEGRLALRHPLIRTAVYGSATLSRRLDAHRALADAYAEAGDPCHQAWHLAAGVTGRDEEVAAALVRAAEAENGGGGGHPAVAAMYERAASFTPDPTTRARRLARAAQAAADSGLTEMALSLADRAAGDVTDPLERAGLVLIQATLADEQDRTKEASQLMVDTAISIVELDRPTAGYLLFHGAAAAANAGDYAAVDKIAERAEGFGLPDAHLVRALARMFAGQNPLGEHDAADGQKALRELLDGMNACIRPRDVLQAGWWTMLLGDIEAAHDIAVRLDREFRDEGALGLLTSALTLRARTSLLHGRHREVVTSATEGLRIAQDTGQRRLAVYLQTVLALLAAIQGDQERCEELTREALDRGVPPSSVHAAGALSLLDLGLGRHEAAFKRLTEIVAGPQRQGSIASIPDLVEAAVRSGRPEEAREAVDWYRTWAGKFGHAWAESVALRCEALLAGDDEAGGLYAKAVTLHNEAGMPPFERARTELLYGEWLRRARRRNEARGLLRTALEIFEGLEAAPWAERARTELRATGESVADAAGADRPDALSSLTPQELQVARLAAAGLSNREIGAQLFLSPRTVGYHLYKIYPKLGIASRGELARLDLA
ncbi:AAA family ATPase [Actinomadura barringtoniae]|uniref:AAA family ATPase n=1 Tax=Actinomadura barringtoniae TaxID=1427535 RepID=A0A939PIW5_9ACTN|nr:LuxR family transcriptional regulator [Actinomadura barringtoniae]MBO2452998.1 AAA family ATPase [Actinomadura barringtoniae]